MSNVYVQCKPNHYVGPRVAVTIHCKYNDANSETIKAIKKRIELDVDAINYLSRDRREKETE